MKNKGKLRLAAMLLAVMCCLTVFSTVAYADGGDYQDYELPPNENTEPTEPEQPAEPSEPEASEPGAPFTEDGIASTRDLLYDKNTNKQFIVVETRNGNTFYIVIDYDKLLDEEEERYQTYFLNPVDEADLLALCLLLYRKMHGRKRQYKLYALQNRYDKLRRRGKNA